jgi:hypothetical protein
MLSNGVSESNLWTLEEWDKQVDADDGAGWLYYENLSSAFLHQKQNIYLNNIDFKWFLWALRFMQWWMWYVDSESRVRKKWPLASVTRNSSGGTELSC